MSFLLSRRSFLALLGAFAASSRSTLLGAAGDQLRTSTLPLWRGFNLPDRMHASTGAFREEDFDLIAGWGFNFVRLPLDYRIWTISPGVYDEAALRTIEETVRWGSTRKIHVSLTLVHAPGHPPEGSADKLNLWADGPEGDDARDQFVAQWGMLSARFKDLPGEALSFDLINEPPYLSRERYVDMVGRAAAAIQTADGARLIIAEGLVQASTLIATALPELRRLKAAESLHMYFPELLTNFRHGWSEKADALPTPAWPTRNVLCGFLCGPAKKAFHAPLAIRADFSTDVRLDIEIETVVSFVRLVVSADGRPIYDQRLDGNPSSKGQYKESRHVGSGNGYFISLYDVPVTTTIPAGTKAVTLEVVDGDWMTFANLRFTPGPGADKPVDVPVSTAAWLTNPTFTLRANGALIPDHGPSRFDRSTLFQALEPWRKLRQSGVGVHVGEFGVNNRTPHDVTLAWMRDNLSNFKAAGFGWAMWEFRGPWGVIDSGRDDVSYEPIKGHKLDRQMLDLLQAF